MNHPEEYILCAAIHFDDEITHAQQPINIQYGYVICGRRHHNCFAIAGILDPSLSYLQYEKEQGFVTSKDRFITREEAKELAQKTNQIISDTTNNKLFSEDLY